MDRRLKKKRSQTSAERGRSEKTTSQAAGSCSVATPTTGQTIGKSAIAAAPILGPKDWLFAVALAAALFLAYKPAWHGGFIWDDDANLTNLDLHSAEGLRRIWLEPVATPQYYPLVYTTFWVEHNLWGNATLGYHLVSIALHLASALLVLLILRRLKIPGAPLAAAIFALHPIQVESVAWITELKNTLSLVFYLGAMLSYLRFDQTRSKVTYGIAFFLFVLALLSKTVTLTLPAALLVILWWQRGRLSWRRDVLPLAPFFLFGVAIGPVTMYVERVTGAQGTEFELSWAQRLLIAGRAGWFYLVKLFWPANLTFIYPRWQVSPDVWWQWLFPFGTVIALVAAWLVRHRARAPLAALLFFGGTLFPVLGFFNVYYFNYSFVADHFQYVASLGIIALFSASAALLLERWRMWDRPAGYGLCFALLATLTSLTCVQCGMYANAQTLYETTIARNPDCWLAENNLGASLAVQGQTDAAIDRYRRALEINPNYPVTHNNLGLVLAGRGQLDSAIAHYRKALEIDPHYAEAHFSLGTALARGGQIDAAIVQYQKALEIKPDFAEAHIDLAVALLDRGQADGAIAHYQKALEIKPGFADVRLSLGNALRDRGQIDAAIVQYQKALAIKPDFAEAHFNLGDVMRDRGQIDAAIAHFQNALEIKPGYADAHLSLGDALRDRGQIDAAIVQYQRALEIKPGYAEAHNNFGNALLRRGEIDLAIAHYQKALEIKPDYAEAHNNLGLALARHGQADLAIAHYQKALGIKPDFAEAHFDIAVTLARRGQIDAAIDHYQKALEIKPGLADAHVNLGCVLAGCGQIDLAIAHFQKALEIKPDYVAARQNLAIVLSEREKIVKNLADQREAVRLHPNDAALLNDTAWTLATNPNASIRNGAQAVELAARASKLSGGNDPAILGTLAAAYAEAGHFSDAVRTGEQAERLAVAAGNRKVIEQVSAGLKLYKSGKPYRQTPSF
jgi:tetratricopeptide (TPR) repeat protein